MFFNDNLKSYGSIQEMFVFMRRIPISYINNLKKLYIVNPTFLVKSYVWWTKKIGNLKDKIMYLNAPGVLQTLEFYKPEMTPLIQKHVKKGLVGASANNQQQNSPGTLQ